jgi:divalent metal cation (Fe/Co/Zn/Cd) transporter
VDSELEGSAQGIRAVKISLVALGVTALLQVGVVAISGSVALLADTVHNFSDALTAVPLWIAFVLSRRAASRRYTYGYGRMEDLAGLFVVTMIALSAVIAGWEAIDRLLHPAPAGVLRVVMTVVVMTVVVMTAVPMTDELVVRVVVADRGVLVVFGHVSLRRRCCRELWRGRHCGSGGGRGPRVRRVRRCGWRRR